MRFRKVTLLLPLRNIKKSFSATDLPRYSGTEPKARLLLEGRDAKVLESWSKKICGVIQKQIGV